MNKILIKEKNEKIIIDEKIKNGENLFIVDPKEEYLKQYNGELKNNDYEIINITLVSNENKETYNPIETLYRLYKEKNYNNFQNILEKLCEIVCLAPTDVDPFWGNSARDFMCGLIIEMIIKYDKPITFKEVFDEIDNAINKEYFTDENSIRYASAIVEAPSETKGSILAVLRQRLGLFARNLYYNELLNESSFKIEDNKKYAIFVKSYDEEVSRNSLIYILMNEVKLYANFVFILNNFYSLPTNNNFKYMVSANKYEYIICVNSTKEIENKYDKDILDYFEIID